MTAAEQAWIDNSLARLEELHTQREPVEAANDIERLAEIDEEIASLTEVLETVADASGPINVAANTPAPVAAVAPVAVAAQPIHAQPAPAQALAPVAAAPAPHADPFAIQAQPAPQGGFGGAAPAVAAMPMAATTDYVDDDEFSPKSRMPLVIGLLVLVVAGGGAFAYTQSGKEEDKAPAAPQETKIITAAEVPEDTQEPEVAKGGEADRTPGTEFAKSKSPKPSGGRTNRRGNSGRSSRRNSGKSKGNSHELNLGKSRDPLAGM